MLWGEKQVTALLLNHISWLTGQYTQGLLDQEFRCIILELSSAWKTAPCLQRWRPAHTVGIDRHTQFQAWGWRSVVQKPLRWCLTVAGFLRPPSSIPSNFLEIEQSLSKVNSQWSTRSKVYCSANWNVLDCQQQREDMFWGPKGMKSQRACFYLLENHHLVHVTWAMPGIWTAVL